ncbi:hypothetical protein EJ08DRAFT_565087, partial [Tothia fuscella]
MAGIALNQPHASFTQKADGAPVVSPLYQRRGVPDTGHIEMLPNPDFVFPTRSPEHSPSLDNWTALNRRPRSAQQSSPVLAPSSHRPRGSVNALPNFSFNPSIAPAAISPMLATPPHSPNLTNPATPSRGIGHKRGGSEFIGGDGMGGAGLLSTSPTKGDAILPAPRPSGRLGPPGGGSGHRHRRSGAISCHDLQSIMQPKGGEPPLPRGGSAPATPLESDEKPFFSSSQRRRTHSQAEIRTSPDKPSVPRSHSDNSPPRVVPRVRVGFADRVEYIRPLSTISSETEGSMSTIRGGHSLSNSMSSVISVGAASPPSLRMARSSLNTTFEDEVVMPRPQSSGAILDSVTKQKSNFRGDWQPSERPKSAITSQPAESQPSVPTSPTCGKSPKRKSFSWWDTKRAHADQLPSSISEPSLLPSPPTSPENAAFSGSDESNAEKTVKTPRKVKLWGHSIMSRKTKSHGNLKAKSAEDRRSTPPGFDDTLLSPNGETFGFGAANFEPNFDVDDTITIVSDARPAIIETPAWSSREHAESDALSPVIDLDAALGPFNTPPLGANIRNTPARAPPRARRSMHSLGLQAGAYSSLSAPHRRTESAPELVPFEMRVAKSIPASTMPDVFEEEDEEEAEGLAKVLRQDLPSPDIMSSEPELEEAAPAGVGVHVVDILEHQDGISWSMKPGFGIQRRKSPPPALAMGADVNLVSPGSSSADDYFTPQEVPQIIQRDPSPVEVVEDFEEPRASSLTRESDSTITPPLTAEDAKNPQPLNFSLPLPPQAIMTPDTLSGSSFSSRAFNTSQVSLNTPRLSTATSSGTTDNRSFSFGEPGPAVRESCDDLPSLSSSRSTMTTPPQHVFTTHGSLGPEGRKSSIHSNPSVDEQRRNAKRGSIASLSRLVGTTFGEKSKLSIESRPQSQHITSTTAPKKK